MSKQKFIAYWGGYFHSPDQTLNKCPDYIDTVVIAFIGPDSNHQVETTYLCKIFRKDNIIKWVNELKARGKKILLSLLDTPENHWDKVDFNVFEKSLRQIMIDWNVDGFDIDAESGEKYSNNVEAFVKLINCARNVVCKNGIISYTCYEGKEGFDSGVFEQVKDKINYIQTMAYFDDFDSMVGLYEYYRKYFNDEIVIGVKAGKIQDSGTSLTEVIRLCQWNKFKLGIMLWTFNRDNFAFTHQNNWIWCETINKNLQIRESLNWWCF